jgi:chemotaxis signal transduction protein/NADH:ubiquinone oxidoreductase subunit E
MELNLIKFRVGGVDFGISVEEVQQVIFYPKLRPLPRPLPHVKGVFEFRDSPILLVDLRKRLGLDFTGLTRNTRVIVARLTQGLTGILVESLSDFKRISTESLLPPIPLAGFGEDLLKGIYLQDDEMILLPDFNKILFSFIRIQLSPPGLFDRIALQHKFNKGPLISILEEIYIHRQIPFSVTQAKILARSMYLPVTQLCKIISFYQRFHPISPPIESLESPRIAQFGDQKYLQLSQRLEEEERKGKLSLLEIESNRESQDLTEKWDRLLDKNLFDLPKPGPKQEARNKTRSFLASHLLPLVVDSGKQIPSTRYRDLARRLDLPAPQLAHFISFYKGNKDRKMSKKDKGEAVEVKSKPGLSVKTLPEDLLSDKNQPLPEVLYTILDRQGSITPEDIRFISRVRNLPATQVYKLVSFLYGTKVILKTENLTRNPQAVDNASYK